ncbi:hypothetical protein C7H73_14830 [Pulveribacter suum]|uniref:Acyltransferase 3 domain-containing protein n=2 Tax=Pulveribacter suum TaxID=2116657 RepID=A0A2P1NP94_9BURK|nr:hypothetical protein C7H73_14830 [Pulveribacter suum]
MVLFFHMHPHWNLVPVLAPTAAVTRWGFSGVDIFFALSGFVVYRSAQRSVANHGAGPFLRRRLLRIYLGYWPVLLLIAAFTLLVYQEKLPPVGKMIFSTLLLYPNIWDNWLPPAWSLTMEIYFYLWITAIALLPWRWQPKAIAILMALLAAWGAGWLIFDAARVFEGRQPLRYGLTGLGLEFLAGALLARAYDRGAAWLSNSGLTVPLCLCAIAAGISLGNLSPYFDRVEVMRAASFGVMGVAALTLILVLEHSRFTPPRWLVHIGDASFSLYLLHTFLLDASGRLRMEWQVSQPGALLCFMLALPVAIVILSLLWYRWVEKPLMKVFL